jgi:acyl-CoA reductase-like NAD-dependent aldehyde dehydrogenase
VNEQESTMPAPTPGLEVRKTYKLYIGGAFPRSESGRYDTVTTPTGPVAVSRASRKDLRDAVVAARGTWPKWRGSSPYLRGQILYRAAEMLDGRRAQLVDEVQREGAAPTAAEREVAAAVDRLVHYAGWADKFQQVFSTVNPVQLPYFTFSVLEPTGVVAVFAPAAASLAGLVSVVAPVICSGNACVVIAPVERALSAATFAEVLHSSDLPGGTVNVLTGRRAELLPHAASHMDVNAVVVADASDDERAATQRAASENLKRTLFWSYPDWTSPDAASPYLIAEACETKTTWHPIGI